MHKKLGKIGEGFNPSTVASGKKPFFGRIFTLAWSSLNLIIASLNISHFYLRAGVVDFEEVAVVHKTSTKVCLGLHFHVEYLS